MSKSGLAQVVGGVNGHLRVAHAISRPLCAAWGARLLAGEDCPVVEVAAALAMLGPTHDIGWWTEAAGLPDGSGFVLDLGDRASEQGGLLLTATGEDTVTGWRPESGALTAYEAGRMLLSPVRPGAERRLAIAGRLG